MHQHLLVVVLSELEARQLLHTRNANNECKRNIFTFLTLQCHGNCVSQCAGEAEFHNLVLRSSIS